MNLFDIKSVLLAKHAQHVVLIHFPIALFLVGVVADIVAHRKKSQTMAAIARFNLVIAAASTVPVLLTGMMAWYWALGAPKIRGILMEHLVLALTTSVLLWVVGWIHFREGRSAEATLPRYRLPIELIAAALLSLTAHLGGFLSGVNLPT